MSVTLSIRPTPAALIGALFNNARNALGRGLAATVDAVVDNREIWTLYRMTGSADSVPTDVMARLARTDAS